MQRTASKPLLSVLLLSSALAAAACGKSEDKAESTPKATETEAASEVATLAKTETPKAPAYSPEAAAKAIEAMQSCENRYSCDPLETLVGFGKDASKDLAAVANDASKTKEAREIALEGLGKIQDPAVGLSLFEAGKIEQDFILRSSLFKTAGKSGGDETFDAMIAHYASEASKDHRLDMRAGLREFGGKKLFDWAVANYPEDEDSQVRFADLVTDAEDEGNAESIAELIGKTKDTMAKHRLAAAAVKLGDAAQISVLIDGLKAENQYDRSDAANFLGDIADQVPADRKQEVIDATKAAKAKDAGGLTSMGYDKVLKKLGAE